MGNIECPSCHDVKVEEKISPLSHWPIQIKLMGTVIPFLKDADLMVAADCTAFATREFHKRYLGKKKLLIGCPKLDDAMYYVEKFTKILRDNNIKSLTCLRMEVPCCGGMTAILREALKRAGKEIPFKEIIIGVKGDHLKETVII